MSINGALKFSMTDVYLFSAISSGPALYWQTSTNTVATMIPDKGDVNSGISGGASGDNGEISYISNGQELARTSPDKTFYGIRMTAGETTQHGMIVTPSTAADMTFLKADGATQQPIGVYNGTSVAAAASAYTIDIAGIAYVAPQEGLVAVTSGWVCTVGDATPADDGYMFCAVNVAGVTDHTREIGHPLTSEAADTFNGDSDVDTTENTIANVTATWAVGDPVIYWDAADTPPTGLTDGSVYWVCSQSTGTVRLSATYTTTTCNAASSVDITAAGSGTSMYLMRLPKVVLHFN